MMHKPLGFILLAALAITAAAHAQRPSGSFPMSLLGCWTFDAGRRIELFERGGAFWVVHEGLCDEAIEAQVATDPYRRRMSFPAAACTTMPGATMLTVRREGETTWLEVWGPDHRRIMRDRSHPLMRTARFQLRGCS